jgi:hypothetical protein
MPTLIRYLTAGLLVAGCATLGACAPARPAPEQGSERGAERQFSAEEKAIARSLSLGAVALKEEITPAYRAALCELTLASVQEQIATSGMLTDEQQRAFSQAQAMYRQRAKIGLSQDQAREVRAQVVRDFPDPSARARFVVECLRELAEPAT